ncbi:DAK2 domain-containing protein [Streptomyces sp. F63]|uniref:DAK2 domain-containing protein n=1 Tax=Streptomyces sp. F63 TaxID=2824887 RepID=UPI001B3650AD|nr:DAK2 domain-containing protein [Streptomyces sp. F63]MBQ0984474.1 DAK2 domain-containing protein [Streptomyces sp. F63]
MVRTWCELALEALGRARESIDAINVYPVADGDTGTNLYFTVESAAQAVEAVFAAHAEMAASPAVPPDAGQDTGEDGPGSGGAVPALPDALRAMTHGALIGARGNSGTILSQMLRGLAEVLAAPGEAAGQAGREPAGRAGGERLRRALRQAGEAAYRAVAHPVEGTMLTVAAAAADAAERAGGGAAEVVRAAYEGARAALEETPGQLEVLGRAGVVDAGGCGLVTVLGALMEAVTGESPGSSRAESRDRAGRAPGPPAGQPGTGAPSGGPYTGGAADGGPAVRGPAPGAAGVPGDTGAGTDARTAVCTGEGPAFEVMYLLEAGDRAVETLRARLDPLGDSLVVVGGDGLWNVHVHVDDAGAAVEAGIEAGRPYRIRITHFGSDAHRAEQPPRAQRAVVMVVPGDGLAELCREAGATVVTVRPGEPPAAGELVEALRRAHAREVVLLPNDTALRHTAAAAAEQARAEGIRVAVIPTRSPVQGIAALAVHGPDRRFDEDVVAMTSAAGATRHAELAVAEHRSWTMAGVCQAGDVLGLIDGDVAVIGQDLAATAEAVLERMLAAGGELVTLVLGAEAPDALAGRLEDRVRREHLAVDTVVHRGGQPRVPLIIGVE